jgi:preprotein translocase subunit SecD
MRIGAIVAMFLGGLYILAPTLVQEDFETRLACAAAFVDGSEAGEPEAAAPAWYAGYLPDTAISLGLDLQGGIDLTMQVGLEEALLGQANRDATYLVDRAEQDGFIAESIRSDRDTPTIWIQTDSSLSQVQAFIRAALPEYVYDSTDGNRHSFEMQDERQKTVQDQAVEQVLETLRKRVDETGVKEPSIVKKGGGSINIQLPGMVDYEQAVEALGTTAVLEFRLHDPQFDDAVRDRMLLAAEAAMTPEDYIDDQTLNEWLWDTKRLDEDRVVLWQYLEVEDGRLERDYPLVLMNEIMLTGNDINNARVGFDQSNQPYVSMDFKPRGGRVFCEVTSENVGRQFGILLDNRVRSHPNIREAICGGGASIEMGQALDALRDAQTLALVLRTGALDAPVVISQVRQVGASLGQDSIQKGSSATVIGGLIVLFFMFLWYRSSGLIANVALILNVILVLASLALFGATLTLPGIAGIALTIGMAVDANIIIYERIREELRLGVQARKAVDVGFSKAKWAVLDANITTGIAAVVLYSYGTGPIKGFAVTLLIGICTTLVTALFVTQTLLELRTRNSNARLVI